MLKGFSADFEEEQLRWPHPAAGPFPLDQFRGVVVDPLGLSQRLFGPVQGWHKRVLARIAIPRGGATPGSVEFDPVAMTRGFEERVVRAIARAAETSIQAARTANQQYFSTELFMVRPIGGYKGRVCSRSRGKFGATGSSTRTPPMCAGMTVCDIILKVRRSI